MTETLCEHAEICNMVFGPTPDNGEPLTMVRCNKKWGKFPTNARERRVAVGVSANMRTLTSIERFCREREEVMKCSDFSEKRIQGAFPHGFADEMGQRDWRG